MSKRITAIVFLMTISIVLVSFQQSFTVNKSKSIERGKTVYETYCQSCHMEDGNGMEAVFPPLAKSPNLADKNRLLKIIVQGMRGPIKVNNVNYDGEMPGTVLTDEQAADVANYIRNSWGNKAETILPSQVQPALKATVKGYQKY
ncbi:MAG: cytochrome c [Chitinophagaceae bacterium]|nr:cytochrome c [Chitinophagaceae bacterium]